jgi:hypothetical protein
MTPTQLLLIDREHPLIEQLGLYVFPLLDKEVGKLKKTLGGIGIWLSHLLAPFTEGCFIRLSDSISDYLGMRWRFCVSYTVSRGELIVTRCIVIIYRTPDMRTFWGAYCATPTCSELFLCEGQGKDLSAICLLTCSWQDEDITEISRLLLKNNVRYGGEGV